MLGRGIIYSFVKIIGFSGVCFSVAILMYDYQHYHLQRPKISTLSSTNSPLDENQDHLPKAYVALVGRLGNNLYQLASLYGLSKTFHHTPVFYNAMKKNDYHSMFPYFKMKEITSDHEWEEIKNKVAVKREEWHHGLTSGVGPSIDRVPGGDVILCCYIQAKDHFLRYRDEIMQMFVFNDAYQSKAEHFLQKVKHKEISRQDISTVGLLFNYVGIHIRRGDIGLPKNYEEGYRMANMTYFESAMAYFEKKYDNVVFIIGTNDKDWASQNFKRRNVYISDLATGEEDMSLLVSCNHTITSSGTFSWWISFFTRGETIAFKGHIDPESPLGKKGILKGRCMPGWIELNQNKTENDIILNRHALS